MASADPATATVAIDRIAAGGDGVGRLPDGRAVFVPRTAPGDVARVAIVRTHARFARGMLVGLDREGSGRVEPRCSHYTADECGGCQLQHLALASQREVRRAIVGDALRRIGGLETDDPPLEAAPAEWGYRAKISLDRGRGRRFGFHRVGRPGEVFDLCRCEVAVEPVNLLWGRVRGVREHLPPHATRLVLRVDRQGGDHLIVETTSGEAWTRAPALLEATGSRERSLTIWWRPEGGVARVLAGADDPYPAVAFEQVNPVMGDRVRAFAVGALGDLEGATAWDLYAGIGETSSQLAAGGARVESVEHDRRAVEEAERRHVMADLQVTRRAARVEVALGDLSAPDLVVTNPPRTGMDRSVVEALRTRPARRVAYVSCDPATLARDLARLVREGPYRLAAVRAFDLFPQTAHVETVAVLEQP